MNGIDYFIVCAWQWRVHMLLFGHFDSLVAPPLKCLSPILHALYFRPFCYHYCYLFCLFARLLADFLCYFSLWRPTLLFGWHAKLIIAKAIKLASANAVKKTSTWQHITKTPTNNNNNNKKWGSCESLSNNKLQLLLIWHVKSENLINEA